MMKLCVTAATLLLFYSCNSGTPTIDSDKKTKDSTVFYPVHEFLLNEIKTVDSTPFYIYKLTNNNGRKDSSGITLDKFNQLVKPFTAINTNDEFFKKNYKENVFEDQSTNSITLTYTSTDNSLPLKTIEILLSNENQQVKRVFITSSFDRNDTAVNEKMGWKTNESFYINRSIQPPGKPEQTELNTVIWNKKD